MNTTPTEEREGGHSGHYITAGVTLMTFGGFAAIAALIITYILQLDLRFMDGPSMAITAGIIVVVGWVLRSTGRSLQVVEAEERG